MNGRNDESEDQETPNLKQSPDHSPEAPTVERAGKENVVVFWRKVKFGVVDVVNPFNRLVVLVLLIQSVL